MQVKWGVNVDNADSLVVESWHFGIDMMLSPPSMIPPSAIFPLYYNSNVDTRTTEIRISGKFSINHS